MRPEPAPLYCFRTASAADGAAINELYCRVTGYRRSLQHWHWLWREAPAGAGVSNVIERVDADGRAQELVGHHGVVRLHGWADGSPIRVGKTENTMVDPAHRARLLYPRMERQMLLRYRGEFEGIFSLRGPSAALRMRSALGYRPGPRLISEIWYYGWRNCLRSMGQSWWRGRRRIPHCIGAWDARTPRRGPWTHRLDAADRQRIEGLMASERDRSGVHLSKSPEFLAWRYLRHPAGCYAFSNLGDVCVVAHEFRRAILVLDEVLPGDIVDLARHELWRRVLQLALDSGYAVIAIEVASANRAHRNVLKSCGWSLFRESTSPGISEEQGPPIWSNPEGPQAHRLDPERWVLGASASEGP